MGEQGLLEIPRINCDLHVAKKGRLRPIAKEYLLRKKDEETESEPVETGGPTTIARDVQFEHPGADIAPGLRDYVTVAIPRSRALESQLIDDNNNPNAVQFLRSDGRTFPARVRTVRGKQAVFVDCVCAFRERVEEGVVIRADGADVGAIKNPFDERPVPMLGALQPFETTLSSSGLSFFRLSKFRENGSVFFLRETAHGLSPVTDVSLSACARRLDAGAGWLTAKFESGYIAGEDDGGVFDHGEWGTLPTRRFRVVYPNEVDNPVAADLQRVAHLEPPAGMFTRYRETLGSWGPLGVMPKADQQISDHMVRAVDDWLAEEHYYAARPFAQNFRTLDAGAQRFGVAMDPVDLMSPLEARRVLRTIAEDELLRPVHWVDDEGRFLRAKDRRNYRTFGRVPHEPSMRRFANQITDDFGGFPSRVTDSGRWADDLQHTDDLALHAYLALFDDDWPLEMCARQIVERDAHDRGHFNGWVDATGRGEGRPGLSLAWAAWLFGSDYTGITARNTMRANLAVLLQEWDAKDVAPERPIKPYGTSNDNRWATYDEDGKRLPSLSPYEHGTIIAWLCAMARAEVDDDRKRDALFVARVLNDTIHGLAYRVNGTDLYRHAYVVGVPDGSDRGKRPPAEALVDGNPIHERWMQANRDDSWVRWAGRATWLRDWIDEALGGLGWDVGDRPFIEEEAGVDRSLVRERSALEDNDPGARRKLAEFYRMTACPFVLEQAPLV
ncbi:MAG: hypothetical protein AAF196_06150 [Planctomycetota bacterium]